MVQADALAAVSDEALFAEVQRLTARSNVALADLLAHLGEVERRGIHRLRACASLYTYCIYELRMSEDAACRRSRAARFVREYPELLDVIAKGQIHLTGLLMIGPHLGGERHAEILRRARFRSKRELLRLIAELDPKPEVPALVEPIGPAPAGRATHAAFVEALSGAVRQLRPGSRPEDWIEDGAGSASEDGSVTSADSAPEDGSTDDGDGEAHAPPLHYRVQFTANQAFVDLLEEAQGLLGHETPRPTLPEIQVLALRALVQQLRARKRAASTVRPAARAQVSQVGRNAAPERAVTASTNAALERTVTALTDAAPERAVTASTDAAPERAVTASTDAAPERRGSRYVSASVRRAVFQRDGERCAYRDERGERCRETTRLELHHRHARALGGAATLENLELRCRPHNTLAAEDDFGRRYMDFVRGVAVERSVANTR